MVHGHSHDFNGNRGLASAGILLFKDKKQGQGKKIQRLRKEEKESKNTARGISPLLIENLMLRGNSCAMENHRTLFPQHPGAEFSPTRNAPVALVRRNLVEP